MGVGQGKEGQLRPWEGKAAGVGDLPRTGAPSRGEALEGGGLGGL